MVLQVFTLQNSREVSVLTVVTVDLYCYTDFQVDVIEISWGRGACLPFLFKVVAASNNEVVFWAALELWGPGYMNVKVNYFPSPQFPSPSGCFIDVR